MAMVSLCCKEAFQAYENQSNAFIMLGQPFHKQRYHETKIDPSETLREQTTSLFTCLQLDRYFGS